ncbi:MULTISPECIES: RibD family protein [Aphanothece]|uniref:RibD family protein n=1 Tax=Aphanothece TaxID=1121 RepID=UPI003984E421
MPLAAAGLPTLRLVLAISLDGRLAPPSGGAAQLGGPGDRRALEQALTWADACLIGARTLRLHGGTCLIHAPDLLARRRQLGLSPQPAAVVVSRSGDVPAGLPFWDQPLQRWLLAPSTVTAPPGFDRHLALGPWREALAHLARGGLERLVLLGGAALAGALLAEDLVDELQLTLCPLLLGGPAHWLELPALDHPSHWELLEGRDLGGGEWLLHYRRRASRPDPGG